MKFNKDKIYITFGTALIVLSMIGLVTPLIFEAVQTGDLAVRNTDYAAVAEPVLPTFEEDILPLPKTTPDITVAPSVIVKPLITPELHSKDIKDRLVIARVNINMPVFLSNSEKILNKGAWLFPATSRPELGGNSVIFGHRYKYLPPIANTLYSLDKVKIGDIMVLTWQGKEYKYKVFQKKIVEPTDLSVMQSTSDSRLTVITCTPLFTTKQRLVIVGSLVNP